MGAIYRNPVVSDPVGTIPVDGAGRRLGYSQTSGALTEIPGSVWFGDYDGIGYIFRDFTEPLRLELTGRGEVHYLLVWVERFGGAFQQTRRGHSQQWLPAQGEVVTIPIALTKFIYLTLVIR